VARINERFHLGRPSSDIESSGVLVRQFDTLNDPAMPWLPCPEDEWCGKFGDRFPSTILNAKAKAMFLADGNGGIVIAPMVSIYCAYPEDGNSMDGRKICNPLGGNGASCIPGCYPKGEWCPEVGHTYSCSFPPEQLKEALQAQEESAHMLNRNNEIVVDTKTVAANLPGSIQGFFFTASDPTMEAKAQADTGDVRRVFLQQFELSEADGPPLLKLDVNNADGPFTIVS